MMPLLECRSLRKSFEPGRSAVAGVTLSIEESEIVSLLGPSGCGKTTLLRMIAGLEPPDSGEVWFAGRDMGPVLPHQRDFGMMFQDFALFPHKNVFDNVAFGLQMHGDTSIGIEQRVNEMLKLVELSGFCQREVDQLSGGEQQRIAIARALLNDPLLILADEPTGNLDPETSNGILDLLTTINKRGTAVLVATHIYEMVKKMKARIIKLEDGQAFKAVIKKKV